MYAMGHGSTRMNFNCIIMSDSQLDRLYDKVHYNVVPRVADVQFCPVLRHLGKNPNMNCWIYNGQGHEHEPNTREQVWGVRFGFRKCLDQNIYIKFIFN